MSDSIFVKNSSINYLYSIWIKMYSTIIKKPEH